MRNWLKKKMKELMNPTPDKYKSRLYNSISILIVAILFNKFIKVTDQNFNLHILVYISLLMYSLIYAVLNFVFLKDKELNKYLKMLSPVVSIIPLVFIIYRLIQLFI